MMPDNGGERSSLEAVKFADLRLVLLVCPVVVSPPVKTKRRDRQCNC